jgi:D-tyrosyl-tRNA(Tyr) deacylase
MRAVIQRVSYASVSIEGQEKARIENGLLIFLGIEEADTKEDVEWLSGKISRLRIFHDKKGIMNLSLSEVKGESLVISQFTLHASTRKGNRPSYVRAARPGSAIPLYEQFINQLSYDIGREAKSGEFGAYMHVEMLNDGPVTIIIDTKNRE